LAQHRVHKTGLLPARERPGIFDSLIDNGIFCGLRLIYQLIHSNTDDIQKTGIYLPDHAVAESGYYRIYDRAVSYRTEYKVGRSLPFVGQSKQSVQNRPCVIAFWVKAI
jgi:hypothetical protein